MFSIVAHACVLCVVDHSPPCYRFLTADNIPNLDKDKTLTVNHMRTQEREMFRSMAGLGGSRKRSYLNDEFTRLGSIIPANVVETNEVSMWKPRA